jgi:exopolyphosphatase/guanosine-5'-triphosphate,3'-diphosphate pyrophosphatase
VPRSDQRGGVPDPTAPRPKQELGAPAVPPKAEARSGSVAVASRRSSARRAGVAEPALPAGAIPGSPAAVGQVVAAIDIGAHSAHLLVTRIGADGLEPLLDTSVPLGLGAIVDATDTLPNEHVDRLVAALRDYTGRATAMGARPPIVVATDPLRGATNAARVLARLAAEAGTGVHVLGQEEEGLLTLLGATGGRRPDPNAVVVDVGGGSTEVVTIVDGHAAVSALAVGAARLRARYADHDPPTYPEMAAMRADARIHAAPAPPVSGRAILVVVGGTASNLAKLDDRSRVDGRLTRDRLRSIATMLLATPADEVSDRFGITPQRARVLPAGLAIVEAILDRYRVGVARATDQGLREGLVIATTRAGVAWRDALPRLAAG